MQSLRLTNVVLNANRKQLWNIGTSDISCNIGINQFIGEFVGLFAHGIELDLQMISIELCLPEAWCGGSFVCCPTNVGRSKEWKGYWSQLSHKIPPIMTDDSWGLWVILGDCSWSHNRRSDFKQQRYFMRWDKAMMLPRVVQSPCNTWHPFLYGLEWLISPKIQWVKKQTCRQNQATCGIHGDIALCIWVGEIPKACQHLWALQYVAAAMLEIQPRRTPAKLVGFAVGNQWYLGLGATSTGISGS